MPAMLLKKEGYLPSQKGCDTVFCNGVSACAFEKITFFVGYKQAVQGYTGKPV